MKHRRLSLFAHLLALLLCTLVLVSCEGSDVQQGPRLTVNRNPASYTVYSVEDSDFYNDAANDYAKTRSCLSGLGLPTDVVERLTDDQLKRYDYSYSNPARQIFVLSASETGREAPQIYGTFCIDEKGRVHCAIDLVFPSIPEETYTDFASVAFLEPKTTQMPSRNSGWLMYGEERRALIQDKEYTLCSGLGLGYLFDLGQMIEGLTEVKGQKLYLHFEGEMVMSFPSLNCFGEIVLNYDHTRFPFENRPEFGVRDGAFCMLLAEDPRMSIERTTIHTFYAYLPYADAP